MCKKKKKKQVDELEHGKDLFKSKHQKTDEREIRTQVNRLAHSLCSTVLIS